MDQVLCVAWVILSDRRTFGLYAGAGFVSVRAPVSLVMRKRNQSVISSELNLCFITLRCIAMRVGHLALIAAITKSSITIITVIFTLHCV